MPNEYPDVLLLERELEGIVDETVNNHVWRRTRALNMIPSEQPPSRIVGGLPATDSGGRYNEWRNVEQPDGTVEEVHFYEGTEFITSIEQRFTEGLCDHFGGTFAEPRATSGTMANRIVFDARARQFDGNRMRRVLVHKLDNGGHLSAQGYGAMSGLRAGERFFVPDARNPYKVDLEQTLAVIEAEKPEAIVFGRSMTLFREPVEEARKFIDEKGLDTLTVYDMAHTLGLYGVFQSPLQEGAHVLTGSSHKTFYGAQRGIIVARFDGTELIDAADFISKVRQRAFPGNTSNDHLGTMLANYVALYEMRMYGNDYATQVVQNAQALARALESKGIRVEGAEDGYTQTHQVVINVGTGKGAEMAARLSRNNIIMNWQGLPYDAGFNRDDVSGLRMGVQELTRFGMKEEHMQYIADFVAAVILEDKDVAGDVAQFRGGFTTMQYCLPREKEDILVGKLRAAIDG